MVLSFMVKLLYHIFVRISSFFGSYHFNTYILIICRTFFFNSKTHGRKSVVRLFYLYKKKAVYQKSTSVS